MILFMCSCVGDPITIESELPPGNDSSNQSNEGLVAGISVTVILIVLISSGTAMLILYIWLHKLPKGKRLVIL